MIRLAVYSGGAAQPTSEILTYPGYVSVRLPGRRYRVPADFEQLVGILVALLTD